MPTRRARHRSRPGGQLAAFLRGRHGAGVVAAALVAVPAAAVVSRP